MTAAAVPVEAPDPGNPDGVTIPPLLQIARRALPQWLEGALIPLGIFLLALHFLGLSVAIIAGLGWSVAVIARRVLRKERIHGMLIVGAVFLLARSVVGLMTGSPFLYFLQPIIGTTLVAAAFLVSVRIGRPLAQRFAADFCIIPSHVHADVRVHRVFQRISLMWAAVGFANAAITLWLLTSQPTGTYVVAKAVLGIAAYLAAVGVSVLWFRRFITQNGLVTVGS